MATSYRTVQGDCWDSIARALWGSEFFMHKLMEANPSHADILVFPAGIELAVPEVKTSTVAKDLPPWMN